MNTQLRPIGVSKGQGGHRVGFRMQAQGDVLLIWLSVIALLALNVLTSTVILAGAQILLAIPVLLLFPGYLLSIALFVGAGQLDWISRLGISIVLSMVHVVFCGLCLYFAKIPIERASLLAAFTALLCVWTAIAVVRRSLLPASEAFLPLCRLRAFFFNVDRLGLQERVLFGLISFFAAASLSAILFAVFTMRSTEHFTELSIINPVTGRSDLPLVVSENGHYELFVTVSNKEAQGHTYTLTVVGDNGFTQNIPVKRLETGESWNQTLRIPVQSMRPLNHLQILLFLDSSNGRPYRDVHLWLEGESSK